ncbi:hypothetical protein BGW80DRAFT_1434572 [Lactifluus volemus]|nr:hypothetical protein BGW80DRAFT_1434572 [Lactifluus volemus]
MTYSPIHKASLIDSSSHPPALLELVEQKLSRPIIEYLIDSVVETVDFALGSAFTAMVNNVLARAEVEVPVVLATLIYLNRAKPHLHIALEEWANERVFLGALIVASKYLNDSSLKNVHWAVCTGVFGKRDIGRIEREFLDVLDFELSIREEDLMVHHDAIMTLVSPRQLSHTIPNAPLPELDYSSSSTEASSPPVQLYQETYPVVPVPAYVSQPRNDKKQSQNSTLRILRSFPFSRPFSHSTSSSSNNESHPPSHGVAQQGRCQLLPPFAAQPSAQVYA